MGDNMHANENERNRGENVDHTMTLRDLFEPVATNSPSCIVLPPTNATHFDLKPHVIQLLPAFHGLDLENPYSHVKKFKEQVANQVVHPEENPAAQEEQGSRSVEKRDAEPSTLAPTIETPPRSFIPKAPFPDRLLVPKKGGKFEDILEVFKQVQINIPFLDAIQQVPSYAKFLTDLVTVKRKTNVPKKASLHESNFVQQNAAN